MPVTKLDDKGRVLLPGDLRKAEKLKEGDEFVLKLTVEMRGIYHQCWIVIKELFINLTFGIEEIFL